MDKILGVVGTNVVGSTRYLSGGVGLVSDEPGASIYSIIISLHS